MIVVQRRYPRRYYNTRTSQFDGRFTYERIVRFNGQGATVILHIQWCEEHGNLHRISCSDNLLDNVTGSKPASSGQPDRHGAIDCVESQTFFVKRIHAILASSACIPQPVIDLLVSDKTFYRSRFSIVSPGGQLQRESLIGNSQITSTHTINGKYADEITFTK